MQLREVFSFISALAILATAAPGPHLIPMSASTTVEEKRQSFEVIAGGVLLFSSITLEVGLLVDTLMYDDIAKRRAFTVNFINKLKEQAPGKNIVICNVDYSLSCTPDVKGTVYYKPHIGKKVSYDIVVFGRGCTFDRKGDGGYQNWAYIAPTGCQIDGGHIAC